MSRVTIRARLSMRAVVKEQRLRQMSPTEKTVTNKGLTRVMVKTWSWTWTVTMRCVGWMDEI